MVLRRQHQRRGGPGELQLTFQNWPIGAQEDIQNEFEVVVRGGVVLFVLLMTCLLRCSDVSASQVRALWLRCDAAHTVIKVNRIECLRNRHVSVLYSTIDRKCIESPARSLVIYRKCGVYRAARRARRKIRRELTCVAWRGDTGASQHRPFAITKLCPQRDRLPDRSGRCHAKRLHSFPCLAVRHGRLRGRFTTATA
jgi:hypothetical protein